MITFYVAAAVAIVATALALTRAHPVHALLYLVVSFLALAVIFFILGAPFVAALEVIIYAGAIIVLFLFVVMLLNLGPAGVAQERRWLRPTAFIGPTLLAGVLAAEILAVLTSQETAAAGGGVTPRQVGLALYGPYVLAVEVASMLLLSGAVGAYHLGRRSRAELEARAHSAVPSPDLRALTPMPANVEPARAVAGESPQAHAEQR